MALSQKRMNEIIESIYVADLSQVDIILRYCEKIKRNSSHVRGKLKKISNGMLLKEAMQLLGKDFDYFVKAGDIYVVDDVVRLV